MSNDLLFGLGVETMPGRDIEQTLTELEVRLGARVDLHRIFRRWDDQTPDLVLARTVRHGRVPLISFKPQRRDGSRISWASIAAGHQDQRITEIAEDLAALGSEAYVVFHHEPEFAGASYGSLDDYRRAAQRWRQVFDTAVDANWIHHTLVCSARAYAHDGEIARSLWDPADPVVVGLNAYNYAGCNPHQESAWVPLARLARSALAFAKAENVPLVIAEWGSVEHQVRVEAKAAWITDAAQWGMAESRVEAMSYLHAQGTCNWRLDSTLAANAFGAAARALHQSRHES
jgi:hypothetical protein